jgi:hypothetical protein
MFSNFICDSSIWLPASYSCASLADYRSVSILSALLLIYLCSLMVFANLLSARHIFYLLIPWSSHRKLCSRLHVCNVADSIRGCYSDNDIKLNADKSVIIIIIITFKSRTYVIQRKYQLCGRCMIRAGNIRVGRVHLESKLFFRRLRKISKGDY